MANFSIRRKFLASAGRPVMRRLKRHDFEDAAGILTQTMVEIAAKYFSLPRIQSQSRCDRDQVPAYFGRAVVQPARQKFMFVHGKGFGIVAARLLECVGRAHAHEWIGVGETIPQLAEP